MLCLSYYCLCLLFNKIGEKVLPGSKEGVGGRGRGWGAGGRNDPNNVCTYEYMNKEKKSLLLLGIRYLFFNPLFCAIAFVHRLSFYSMYLIHIATICDFIGYSLGSDYFATFHFKCLSSNAFISVNINILSF
jgi:hypothetical protein